MGWKKVREHYRIGHTVHVRDGCICIGSPYISEIIVIRPDGTLKKRDDGRANADLARYQREMDADPVLLRQLIAAPDTFTASVPVFTYQGGTIIEKQCEATGWPNVTHDGVLMYDNIFSTDRAQIVAFAKRNAEAGIEIFTRNIQDMKSRLAIQEAHLAEAAADLVKLQADYPA